MRLSTAIGLGRVTIDVWESTNLDGCALGMAANAVGIDRKYENLKRVWPWLRNPVDTCPAGCFMHHFTSWVRSVEPAEPAEVPAAEPAVAEAVADVTASKTVPIQVS